MQGFVISFPSILKTVMAYEIDECEDKREIDQYLSYALFNFFHKDYLRSDSRLHGEVLSSKVTNTGEVILVCGIVTALFLFLLGVNWNLIDAGDSCPNGSLLILYLLPIVFLPPLAILLWMHFQF